MTFDSLAHADLIVIGILAVAVVLVYVLDWWSQ